MGLFWGKNAWKTDREGKIEQALACVEKTEGEAALKEIALRAPLERVRAAALDKLGGEALASLILSEPDGSRTAALALERIADPRLLGRIALARDDYRSAKPIVARIGDQAVLETVARESKDNLLRTFAAERIADQSLLKKLLLESEDVDVRRIVWSRLELPGAREAARALGLPDEAACEALGSHCAAPAPASRFIETDPDGVRTKHELICCRLCAKPLAARSRSTAVWDNWSAWYRVDLREWTDFRLENGCWIAQGVTKSGGLRLVTEAAPGCRRE